MSTQREYWNKKINEWSSASYGRKSKISLIEKVATYFRSVNKRKDAGIKLIAPIAKGVKILDLGCGLGEFTFDILQYKPKKIIAIDISSNAIKEAKKIAKKQPTNGNVEFIVEDVTTFNKLPKSDIIVGLGFIDYLSTSQLRHLFKLINTTPYLFSFFEKKISLFNLLHKIYTVLQRCPGAYKYSRAEMQEIVPTGTKLFFFEQNGFLFISNSKQISKNKS